MQWRKSAFQLRKETQIPLGERRSPTPYVSWYVILTYFCPDIREASVRFVHHEISISMRVDTTNGILMGKS